MYVISWWESFLQVQSCLGKLLQKHSPNVAKFQKLSGSCSIFKSLFHCGLLLLQSIQITPHLFERRKYFIYFIYKVNKFILSANRWQVLVIQWWISTISSIKELQCLTHTVSLQFHYSTNESFFLLMHYSSFECHDHPGVGRAGLTISILQARSLRWEKLCVFSKVPQLVNKRSESQAHLIRESHLWSQQCSLIIFETWYFLKMHRFLFVVLQSKG